MTCVTMIDRMLEADLEELEAQGESEIALHVRQCERCRAVASQLVRDTRELARMVPARDAEPVRAVRHGRALRRARSAVIIGVAAVLAVVLVRSSNQRTAVDRSRSIVMQPVTVAPLARIGPDAPPSVPTTTASTGAARQRRPTGRITLPVRRPELLAFTTPAVQAERVVVAPAERAVSVLPVRLSSAPEPPLGDTVSVDPPAGKRAQIIRTGHPGVTVVWLY